MLNSSYFDVNLVSYIINKFDAVCYFIFVSYQFLLIFRLK